MVTRSFTTEDRERRGTRGAALSELQLEETREIDVVQQGPDTQLEHRKRKKAELQSPRTKTEMNEGGGGGRKKREALS
jgi:hypothetical protein